ncbi:MAG: aminotransferase class I/II-fold pyridoxal phosphate-dependent enzyme [Thermoleophilia bacterium]
MRLNPILDEVGTYPFVRIEDAKRRAAAAGIRIIDFGVGDPREPTAPFIRQALADGIRETMGYPRAIGLPELRDAIAAWARARFSIDLDGETEVIPTLGSKEAIFSLAQVVVDRDAGRDLVVTTEPGYPVAERGARFAGADVLRLPLLEQNGYLPDLDAVDDATWRRTAILWLNYPNNPTGACAPLDLYERAAELAERHDFLVASDEAYSELFFAEPPASALQVDRRERVVAVNSLSKRSSMTGYRSGFVAGSRPVLDALRSFRPWVGSAPQEFVQRAAVAAWSDEAHVAETRARYARKRAPFLDLLARKGLRVSGSEATMYLWVATPDGASSEDFAVRLLERGVVVAPGAALGPSGEGYVRLALVPTESDCADACAILEEIL